MVVKGRTGRTQNSPKLHPTGKKSKVADLFTGFGSTSGVEEKHIAVVSVRKKMEIDEQLQNPRDQNDFMTTGFGEVS
ncbi:hypothetical protein L2E82_23120 [Cichorium intybus]|uniref:Uncharacterized protein n=1 Tax=Cichorium intybus TaxID=13427 RepID=A0ACB9E019_CICIN|nr:hypothetical protein L2E82_23120 [Cichorium intybus]